MKVCIARNTEAETNAAIARVTDALITEVNDLCLLTRSRYTDNKKVLTKKSQYKVQNKEIDNYEILLKADIAKGLSNLIQLVTYQLRVFIWFFKSSQKYDVIHAFDLDTGLPAMIVSKLLRKKYVYHIADFYIDSRSGIPDLMKLFVKKLEFLVIHHAETTIVCTEDRIEQIEGSQPKVLSVIHNTPMVSTNLRKLLLSGQSSNINENLVITYVGSLRKSRFIKEIIEVVSTHSTVTLNLAGVGELAEEVESLCTTIPNINFLGKKSYNEALELYKETDLMFAIYDPKIKNHKYSAPNKVYEAMMLGKPVIVAQGTGIDSIVKENHMGYAIKYSKNAFKQQLELFLLNPEELTYLGRNAAEAYEKYSWGSMKVKLQKIYKAIQNEI